MSGVKGDRNFSQLDTLTKDLSSLVIVWVRSGYSSESVRRNGSWKRVNSRSTSGTSSVRLLYPLFP